MDTRGKTTEFATAAVSARRGKRRCLRTSLGHGVVHGRMAGLIDEKVGGGDRRDGARHHRLWHDRSLCHRASVDAQSVDDQPREAGCVAALCGLVGGWTSPSSSPPTSSRRRLHQVGTISAGSARLPSSGRFSTTSSDATPENCVRGTAGPPVKCRLSPEATIVGFTGSPACTTGERRQ